MNIAELRANRIKSLVLPESGLEVVHRKLTSFDFIEQGFIPDNFAKYAGGKAEEMDEKAFAIMFGVLAKAVISIGGARLVSTRPPVSEGEFSVYELPSDDTNFLTTAVFSFCDMGGSGLNPERFPQEQETPAPAGPGGA